MKCLETRRDANGFRRRRYDSDGVRFTTIEVPIEVWEVLRRERGSARDRVGEILRTRARRQKQQQALALMRDGWKAAAAAHHLGVPLRTVQDWRKHDST